MVTLSDPGAAAALIPAFPLAAFLVIVLAGCLKERTTGNIRLSDGFASGISIAAILASLALSVWALFDILLTHPGEAYYHSYTWLQAGRVSLRFGWMVDNLTALMLLVVTVVASMVQIFSLGYMRGEERFPRYYGYLSLFSAAMLVLVLANNLVELFVAWELMGLTSYLLIGFWFEKESAKRAAMKAFLVTRVGDVGLFFGIAYLIHLTGTTDFLGLVVANPASEAAPETMGWQTLQVTAGPQIHHLVATGAGAAALGQVALLLFAGAVGKSAQFPLHVWLPDAMEGPTPVSALIHAATMVAAGVYLVARMYPVFDHGGMLVFAGIAFRPLGLVALTGTITALMAAYFAFTQNDIKRVLAYSTISQLGYMMIGLGCGGVIVSHGREELLAVGYTAGMFHLMTHAFFKGLLFLGSGAVIYACHHEQDMRRMGGLLKLAPITAWTYIIGTLALMGIPGFAGFFSKDTILEAALEFNPLIFAAAVLGAGMTAAYMTRQLIMVFGGEYAGGHGHAHDDHAHDDHSHAHAELPSDPPWVMTGPLVVLAVLAVLSGFVGIPGNWPVSMKIAGFLEYHREGFTHGEHALNPVVMGCGTAAAFIGILVGRLAYDPQTREFRFATQRPTALDRFLYELSYNKGWFDELYRATLVNGMFFASRVCNLMDRYVVDGFVNALGWLTRQGAYACGLIDRFIVDGLVNLTAVIARGLGRGLRLGQSGQVQTYLLIVFVGLVALIGALAAGGTLGR